METIYSLVTKPINQNVGIIRVSGPETLFVIQKLFPKAKNNHSSVEFQKLFINKKFIDDVLLLTFKAPKSFTGEDVVEIQFHGSMYIAKNILAFLEQEHLRQSAPGEFTKQAFLNGKIDLVQSESINQIITSNNKFVYERSAQNLNSTQSNFLEQLLTDLNYILSLIYVSIDYPENTDLPKYSHKGIEEVIAEKIKNLDQIISESNKIVKTSEGMKISLIGAPNVGKSTLLNTLLKEERAIISAVPGTTRDVIKESFYLKGIKITLFDTAGIRETKNMIENLGINKSISLVDESDLIFLLIDSSKNIKEQEDYLLNNLKKNNNIIKVLTKTDKINKSKNKEIILSDYIKISARNAKINEFINCIENYLEENVINFEKEDQAILVSELQLNNFLEINRLLNNAKTLLKNKEPFDLTILEIEEAVWIVNKILGREVDEGYIENLFSNFCIGK